MQSMFMRNRKGRKQARKISRILRKLIRALDDCDHLNGFQ